MLQSACKVKDFKICSARNCPRVVWHMSNMSRKRHNGFQHNVKCSKTASFKYIVCMICTSHKQPSFLSSPHHPYHPCQHKVRGRQLNQCDTLITTTSHIGTKDKNGWKKSIEVVLKILPCICSSIKSPPLSNACRCPGSH